MYKAEANWQKMSSVIIWIMFGNVICHGLSWQIHHQHFLYSLTTASIEGANITTL